MWKTVSWRRSIPFMVTFGAVLGCGSGSSSGAAGPQAAELARFGDVPLWRLWGSSDRDVWLVGGNSRNPEGGGPPESERIVHFTGDGWSDVGPPSTATLGAVWGTAPNDVWAAGGVVLHYDGQWWTQVAKLTDTVAAIWGSSPADVWFAGGFSIWHWDGRAILPVSAPKPPDEYMSLWGFSPNDVWAAGANGTLQHWDGSAWTPVTAPELYIYGLWGASPDELWGVGNDGLQLHWDGARIASTTQGYTGFNTIYGLSAVDIWALGTCCWQSGSGYRAWGGHYDGTRWTNQEVPGIGSATALWATAGHYYALVGDALVRWP